MKVTTKGQVTIPARIRNYLAISPHAEVDFCIKGGMVVLCKHEDHLEEETRFRALRGILKSTRSTDEWMHETRGV